MPIYRTYKKGAACWGIWKMDEPVEELMKLVPKGDLLWQEAVQRFSNEKRRVEWLAVRVLLHHLSGGEHEIVYHPSGKPYLEDETFYISISHTKGYVAVALHPHCEVGIDIEQYATKVLRVRNRFMREDEEAGGDEVYALLLHWSAKETLFKLLGKEEVDWKEHLRIFPFSMEKEGVLKACEYRTEERNIYQVHYWQETDFVLTWCVKSVD